MQAEVTRKTSVCLAAVLNKTCSDAKSCTSDTCADSADEMAPPSPSDSHASGMRFDDLMTTAQPSKNWRLEFIDDETTGKTCSVFYM